MGRIGWGELIVILAIVLLIVGARRLPEVARALGQAIRDFQHALKGSPSDRDDHKKHPPTG